LWGEKKFCKNGQHRANMSFFFGGGGGHDLSLALVAPLYSIGLHEGRTIPTNAFQAFCSIG